MERIATCWRSLTRPGALGPLALLLFTVAGPALGAVLLATTTGHWYEPLVDASPPSALACVVLGGVLLAGLSLVPTHAVSLVAGMLFGVVGGSACALLAITGAALLSYLVVRRLSGDRVAALLDGHARAAAVHRALLGRERRLLWLVVLIRLSPVVPFAATNLALAAAGVRLREYLLGSMVGLAPRIVAVVVAGAGLAELDFSLATDVRTAVLGGTATLLALVLIGRVARQALREAAHEATSAARSTRGIPHVEELD